MIRTLVIAAILAWVPAQAQDARHADANDCAVFGVVMIGKAYEMFSGAYGAECDWKAMGIDLKVVPPPAGKYYEGVKLSLTPPSYTGDGMKASFEQNLHGSASATSYFYAGYTCTAEKRDGQWHSTGCRMRYIT